MINIGTNTSTSLKIGNNTVSAVYLGSTLVYSSGPVPLATETWTGTTGAAWPAQWISALTNGPSGSATIQGDTGQQAVSASGLTVERSYLSGMTSSTNMELVVSFTPSALAGGYVGIAIDSDNGLGLNNFMPTSGYFLQVFVGDTNSSVGLFRCPYDGVAQGGLNTRTVSAATKYKVRLRRSGSTVQYRLWAASDIEPGTWDVTYTDPSPVPAGKVLLVTATTSEAFSALWDDLTVIPA